MNLIKRLSLALISAPPNKCFDLEPTQPLFRSKNIKAAGMSQWHWHGINRFNTLVLAVNG
jgi:hypothetical protein